MNQPSAFRRVAKDVADLCELQLQLLAADGKVAASRSGTAASLLAIAGIFASSAVVVAMLSLASLLHEQAHWTISSSLLAAAGTAAFLAGIFTTLGIVIWKKALLSLNQTRCEFFENLRWIKEAVLGAETAPKFCDRDHVTQARSGTEYGRHTNTNGNAYDPRFSK